MFNERVNLRHADGDVERRVMTGHDDYAGVLRDGFGLDLFDDELDAFWRYARATVSRVRRTRSSVDVVAAQTTR